MLLLEGRFCGIYEFWATLEMAERTNREIMTTAVTTFCFVVSGFLVTRRMTPSTRRYKIIGASSRPADSAFSSDDAAKYVSVFIPYSVP